MKTILFAYLLLLLRYCYYWYYSGRTMCAMRALTHRVRVQLVLGLIMIVIENDGASKQQADGKQAGQPQNYGRPFARTLAMI